MKLVNNIIKRSIWYRSNFPHIKDYQKLRRGLDYLCFGSSPARYAIDFNSENINGCNLAVLAETIAYDEKILKQYHSYLKENGCVIFVLCPFTFLKDKYRKEDGNSLYLNVRYYPILPYSMIDGLDERMFEKWNNPISFGPKVWMKIAWRQFFRTSYSQENTIPCNEFQIHAKKRIDAWMKEFKLDDLNTDNMPDEIRRAIDNNISAFLRIKKFTEINRYKCIVIVPPFTKELTSMIPSSFINYSLFNPIIEIGLPYISYWNKEEWMKDEFFKDSFLMSTIGRYQLTNDVLSKINCRI